MWDGMPDPVWRGRRRYWEDVRWQRAAEGDLAVGLYRWITEHGWENRWYLLFRRFGEDQIHYLPVFSQTILVTPAGALQTSTSDSTWNNASNFVECAGSGARGAGLKNSATGGVTGGGGAAYSRITNFSFATPGTTTYQWQTGAAVAQATATTSGTIGVDGNPTWFNAAADPGNGADDTKCSAAGGKAGLFSTTNATINGGAGGLTTAGWGTTKRNGGRGGNCTAAVAKVATGGGGAGGFTADGAQGVDTGTTATATNGGAADVGGTGAGTAGSGSTVASSGGAGGTGTEFDATHGCGGGGGANLVAGNATSGVGGNYGGGSGGAQTSNNSTTIAAATSTGIIVLNWTPASFTWHTMILDDTVAALFRRVEIVGY